MRSLECCTIRARSESGERDRSIDSYYGGHGHGEAHSIRASERKRTKIIKLWRCASWTGGSKSEGCCSGEGNNLS